MPRFEFEVWCDICGASLCQSTKVDGLEVYVKPCQDCLDTAHDEGRTEGVEEGHDEGHDEGKAEGYEEGFTDGKAEGYKEGKAEGYRAGHNDGSLDTLD